MDSQLNGLKQSRFAVYCRSARYSIRRLQYALRTWFRASFVSCSLAVLRYHTQPNTVPLRGKSKEPRTVNELTCQAIVVMVALEKSRKFCFWKKKNSWHVRVSNLSLLAKNGKSKECREALKRIGSGNPTTLTTGPTASYFEMLGTIKLSIHQDTLS